MLPFRQLFAVVPTVVTLAICLPCSVARAQLRTAHDRIDDLERRFDLSLDLQSRVAGRWQTLEESLAAARRETAELRAELAVQQAELSRQKTSLAEQQLAFKQQQNELARQGDRRTDQAVAIRRLSQNNRLLQERLNASEHQRLAQMKGAANRTTYYGRSGSTSGQVTSPSASPKDANAIDKEYRFSAYRIPTPPISRIQPSLMSAY